jgi:hypothetical protein
MFLCYIQPLVLYTATFSCSKEIAAVRLFVYIVSDENVCLGTVAPRLNRVGARGGNLIFALETNGMCAWTNERL